MADRAEKESWSYRDVLALLLAEEVARRKQTRLQRFTRSAHFPFFKTIDEFDFTLQSTLIEDLSNAGRKGHLQQSLSTYTDPHVLVIDEVEYLTYGQDAANVLFHVVNDRHLRTVGNSVARRGPGGSHPRSGPGARTLPST